MGIRDIFKKKEKNKFLINWEWLGDKQDYNQLIEKCSKNLPPYYKNLSKNFDKEKSIRFRFLMDQKSKFDREGIEGEEREKLIEDIDKEDTWSQGGGISRLNASTCPSFGEIFKNCYVFKSPVDFYIKADKNGMQITSRDPDVFDVTTHSLSGQLWGNFNPNIINVKFETKATIKTTIKNTKMVFLDNIFYTDLPFRVMPGVLEISCKYSTSFNLNTFIDQRFFNKEYTKLVKAGTPLAMLYMPDGVLDIESKSFSTNYRKYFMGDYIKKLNEK